MIWCGAVESETKDGEPGSVYRKDRVDLADMATRVEAYVRTHAAAPEPDTHMYGIATRVTQGGKRVTQRAKEIRKLQENMELHRNMSVNSKPNLAKYGQAPRHAKFDAPKDVSNKQKQKRKPKEQKLQKLVSKMRHISSTGTPKP